jgi:preprotein translocase subunit SecE
MADTIKLLVALIIAIAAVAAFYIYREEASTLIRVLGLLAAVGVSLFVASTSRIGGNAVDYIGDTRVEVRKVVWPTRQETVQTTLLVLLMVVIVAIILWLFDSALGKFVQSIIN